MQLHIAKVNEFINMDTFGVVEVVDRPQSQQVLSTRWVSKQRLDGSHKVRHVARGSNKRSVQIQISTLERQSSRLSPNFSRQLQFTEIQLLLEIVIVHFINHRYQVNERASGGASTGSTVGLFQGMALQESFSRTQDLSSGLVWICRGYCIVVSSSR